MEYTARMNEHALISRAAAAGSCVLLKNVEHTLPFAAADGTAVRLGSGESNYEVVVIYSFVGVCKCGKRRCRNGKCKC